jgi:ribosomal protein S18 acetylase RimI-like enzyme
MNLFRIIAGSLLHILQNTAPYRCLGHRFTQGVIVREATDADHFAIWRLLNPDRGPMEVTRRNPITTDWVAEYNGHIIGYVQLVRHPPEHAPFLGYWLFSLYVKPRWQGLGIGKMLSQAVIERARMEGSTLLSLVVYDDNTRAIRLYRKFGFELHIVPELEPQFENERISLGRRRVVMCKNLTNSHAK